MQKLLGERKNEPFCVIEIRPGVDASRRCENQSSGLDGYFGKVDTPPSRSVGNQPDLIEIVTMWSQAIAVFPEYFLPAPNEKEVSRVFF